MSHIRQQIREAIELKLTGLTTTEDRVYKNRVNPLDKANLPCLVITSVRDVSLGPISHDVPRTIQHDASINITAYVKALDNLDDALDDICEQVEIAMSTDRKLSGLVFSVDLQATDINFNSDGDQPHGIAQLEYSVRYHVKENDPSTAV